MTRIEWGPEGAQVHCANGSCWEADAVIVTVSLGVLKVSQAHSQVCSQASRRFAYTIMDNLAGTDESDSLSGR